jgi:hypothetical protein
MSVVIVKSLQKHLWGNSLTLPLVGKINIGRNDGLIELPEEHADEILRRMTNRFCRIEDFDKISEDLRVAAVRNSEVEVDMTDSPPLAAAPDFLKGLKKDFEEIQKKVEDSIKFIDNQMVIALRTIDELKEEKAVQEEKKDISKPAKKSATVSKSKGVKQKVSDSDKEDMDRAKEEAAKKMEAAIAKVNKMTRKADVRDILDRSGLAKEEWESLEKLQDLKDAVINKVINK